MPTDRLTADPLTGRLVEDKRPLTIEKRKMHDEQVRQYHRDKQTELDRLAGNPVDINGNPIQVIESNFGSK